MLDKNKLRAKYPHITDEYFDELYNFYSEYYKTNEKSLDGFFNKMLWTFEQDAIEFDGLISDLHKEDSDGEEWKKGNK